MRLIGIRGATMLQNNDATEMKSAVIELLKECLTKNSVNNEDLVIIIFTTTEDLNCAFPALTKSAASVPPNLSEFVAVPQNLWLALTVCPG